MRIRTFAVALASLSLIAATARRAGKPVPAPPPTIDPLPAGWQHEKDSEKSHGGKNEAFKGGFEASAEQKADSLDNPLTFDAWCRSAQVRDIKACPLNDEKDTPLKAGKIGPYNTTSYDSTGTVFLSPMHFRTYYVELPNEYARVICWSDDDKWAKVEPDLDGLVKNMK